MYDEKGNLIGFDVEIAKDIASKLGVELELDRSAKTYDEVVTLVLEKKADIAISCLSNTLDRAQRLLLTDPYITLYKTLLINRLLAAKTKRGDDLDKLLNHKDAMIGVVRGSAYVGFAKEEYPEAQVVLYDSWNKLADAVFKGKILALIYDDVAVQQWLKTKPIASIRLHMEVQKDKKDPISMAVHWEDVQLFVWLNQFLLREDLNGTMDKLIIKYFKDQSWIQEK